MTFEEAKMTIYANVVYACEEAGFTPMTIKLVKDACDTVISLAEQADTPQTTLCRECDDYAGDGMYCASNYLVRDFSTSAENCEKEETADAPQTDCGWK